eukprot:2249997-Rhodomonas_salina.1
MLCYATVHTSYDPTLCCYARLLARPLTPLTMLLPYAPVLACYDMILCLSAMIWYGVFCTEKGMGLQGTLFPCYITLSICYAIWYGVFCTEK